MTRLRFLPILGTVLVLAVGPVSPVVAQDKPKQPLTAVKQDTTPAVPQLSVPPAETLVLLIRLSLLTLNDAIQTGDYSVLRERGGPGFRQANSAAKLARIFTTLEAQRPDLAVVAVRTPLLSEAQVVGPQQLLHIKGHFPGQPLQIDFDLTYEPAEGQWQLFGLSVGAVAAQVQVAPEKTSAPAAAAPAASKPEQQKTPAKK